MKNILIIGATSAIASELARRHSARGDKLYLLARNPDKLKTLSDELGDAVIGSKAVDFIQAEQAQVWVREAAEQLGSIDLAWIIHGDLGDQSLSERAFEQAQDTLFINFISAVSFLIPLSQLMKQQGAGKIAVANSVAGDRGRPRNFTYGAAKSGLNTYLQGLRSACWHSGVEIYSFKLGPVDTPMTIDHAKNASFSSVNTVASRMLKGISSRRYTQYVPSYWYWVMAVVRWLPEALFQRLRFLSRP
jgi:short-subunit dehydrogenase